MAKSILSGFEWQLENVLSTDRQGSEEFVLCESRWVLRLIQESKRTIEVILTKLNREKLHRRYKIRGFIEDGNKKFVSRFEYLLENSDFTSVSILYTSVGALQKQNDSFLTGESWTLFIVFAPGNDRIGEKVSDASSQTSVTMDTVACLENLSSDLHDLIGNGAQSDVMLKCGESSFPAHKDILSARSEVFSAMFRSDMAESRTGVIQISDVDASVLNQFLHYIYSGQLSDLSVDTAPKLYAAADKYSVESLKQFCAKFMTENLTRENACKILVLSDTHGDKRLKDSVLCFIANVELLRDKDVWVEFHNEHPRLAGEVLHHAYEAKCFSRVN